MQGSGYHRAIGGNNDDAPETVEMASSVPMSVVAHGNRIAFAAYNEDTNRIILEDYVVSLGYGTHEISERVVAAVRPTLLLLSNKICGDTALLEALCTPPPYPSEGTEADGDAPASGPPIQSSIPYRLMKTSSFHLRTCKASILRLRVGSLAQPTQATASTGLSHQPQRHFSTQKSENIFKVSNFHSLASLIDFESSAEVQALGSLLSFLQSTAFPFEEGGCIFVNDIVRANASMHMTISSDTFSALHIFATERHPLVAAKGSGNSKEGFSLFSLLDRAKSRAGREQLREWMLKPLIDVDAITMRQDGVEMFIMPDMQMLAGNILKFMERIGAVNKILVRIQKCCTRHHDFLVLSKSLSSAVAIIDTLQQEVVWKLRQRVEPCEGETDKAEPSWRLEPRAERFLIFTTELVQRCNVAMVQRLFERVTSIIDEEATFEFKSVVIRPGHHDQLDAFKEQFDRLEESLAGVGNVLAWRMPHLRDFMEVIFLPQVGFLVALQDQRDWSEQGVLTEDFTFVFTEAGKSFFKNTDVRELDENIGDLDAYIKDTEALILAELEDDILDCEYELRCTFNALAELDCILAFADCAIDNKYIRPEVVPAINNCVQIMNGRHPLQEIVIETAFIPNNTKVNSSNRVNIITGPNFSGKSCYARQVGVLTFMAHIGSFIPCDAARISIVDQILARFSSVETCAVPQSSFQLDLTEMGSIMRRASPSALVIIDEFGKGTSPASGIALLTAALQRFSAIQCKVICTTHFLEIFSMELIRDEENGIKALRMAVHIPETSEEAAVPLFRLEEGVANSSAGLVCARMAGVKDAVIARAHEIVLAVKSRRKVQPLVEILRGNLDLTVIAKVALDQFIGMDWKTASNEEIDQFLSKVALM